LAVQSFSCSVFPEGIPSFLFTYKTKNPGGLVQGS
jgi:hypothetical protein